MIILKYFWLFCLIVAYIVIWIVVISDFIDDIKYIKSRGNKKGIEFIKKVLCYNNDFIILLIFHIVILFIISLTYFICSRG